MNKKLLFLLFIFTFKTFGEVTYINRSPRGLLMGDAYTSIATDEYTLFYNPALLARHEWFSFTPFNLTISGTNPLGTDIESTDSTEPTEIAETYMNIPVNIGLNIAPGFKMGSFGMSVITNNDTNFIIQNVTTPTMQLDQRFDRGFVMGYAHDIKASGDSHLAAGFGMKYLEREGIFKRHSLLGTGFLNAATHTEMNDILDALGQAKGRAWGFDFGLDWYKGNESSEIGMGLSLMDMYTKFTVVSDGNSTDNPADDNAIKPQPMDVNFGTHWMQGFGPFSFTISADVRSLQDSSMQALQRLRLGFEVDFLALGFMGGWNAGYYSYGAKLDLGLIELMVGFYDFEIGQTYQEQRGSNFLLYLSFLSFEFDASG